jgi:acetyl esterase/lipase
VDTIRAGVVLADFVRDRAASLGIRVKDVIVVGFSIGMYLSLRTAIELKGASVILVSPPSDLKSVTCTIRGYSLPWLPKFATRYAYPADRKVSLQSGYSHVTVGDDGARLLHECGGSISGKLTILMANDDCVIP